MEKNNAINQFEQLIKELNIKSDVIKNLTTVNVVNCDTCEHVGFVLIVTLNQKYRFDLQLLQTINDKLDPDSFFITHRNRMFVLELKYYYEDIF